MLPDIREHSYIPANFLEQSRTFFRIFHSNGFNCALKYEKIFSFCIDSQFFQAIEIILNIDKLKTEKRLYIELNIDMMSENGFVSPALMFAFFNFKRYTFHSLTSQKMAHDETCVHFMTKTSRYIKEKF